MTMKEEAIAEATLWHAVEALVEAISARNQTNGHSVRVAEYAVRLARALGVQSTMIEQIRLGALLHDIGQIYWPDDLVRKQGVPLSDEERHMIESHTYKGVELLSSWSSLSAIKPYVLYHQEWIDGSGYPYGIQGDALPIEVQIVSLADVYEALRHPRQYRRRNGYTSSEAIEIMQAMRGKRWKAELFDRFAAIATPWE